MKTVSKEKLEREIKRAYELIDEAQALGQEASEAAVSGTTGTGQIVD